MSSTSSSASLVTVQVEDLLRFFDEKPDWSLKRATSVVGIAGEDLNAASFQHYVESKGGSACVLREHNSTRPLRVTTGKRKGYWLDRWIRVKWPDESGAVFQTEIKNWSSHAIQGRTLCVSSTAEQLREYKVARWKQHWDEDRCWLRGTNTAKVLFRMQEPKEHGVHKSEVRPLLIFWEALAPAEEVDQHLFRVNVASDAPEDFKELWVFSVSSYLRSVRESTLDLDMPEAASRLGVLGRLFPGIR